MMHNNLSLSEVKTLAKKLVKKELPKRRKIGLIGNLGSGKTTFVTALAAAMGIKGAKSPTFTVVNCYQSKPYSFYHIDLYRLEKSSELRPLGLEEIWKDQDAVALVEWIDKFPSLKKKCDLLIEFQILKNNKRNVTINRN